MNTLAQNENNNSGSVKIIKDNRLDLIIKKQTYLNALALRHQSGYRVQVITTGDRNKATEVKAQLMRLFPQYRTYLTYHDPYFKVRIGDFKSQEDAQALQNEITQYFSSGVFIVPDIINASLDKDNTDDSTN